MSKNSEEETQEENQEEEEYTEEIQEEEEYTEEIQEEEGTQEEALQINKKPYSYYDNNAIYNIIQNAKNRRLEKMKSTYNKILNDGPTYDYKFNRRLSEKKFKVRYGPINSYLNDDGDDEYINIKNAKNISKIELHNKQKFDNNVAIKEENLTKNDVIDDVNNGIIEDEEDYGKLATDIINEQIGQNKRLKQKQQLNVKEAFNNDIPNRFKSPEMALNFIKKKGDDIIDDYVDDDEENEKNDENDVNELKKRMHDMENIQKYIRENMDLEDEKNKIEKIDINELRKKIEDQKKQSGINELIDNIDDNIDKINTDIINEHLNKNLTYINKNAYLSRLAKSINSNYSSLIELMRYDVDLKKEIDDKYKKASNDFKQKQSEKGYNLSPLKTRSKTKNVNRPEPETPTKFKPTVNSEIEKLNNFKAYLESKNIKELTDRENTALELLNKKGPTKITDKEKEKIIFLIDYNSSSPNTPTKERTNEQKVEIVLYNDIVSKINSWKTLPRKINEDKFISDLSSLIGKQKDLTRNIVQKYNLYERFNKSQIQKRKDEREKNKNEKEKQKDKVEDIK